jgi:hypothetical protein
MDTGEIALIVIVAWFILMAVASFFSMVRSAHDLAQTVRARQARRITR